MLGAAEEETDDATGELLGIVVPDSEALARIVAVARCLVPWRLDGAEVDFLRRVVGMTGKDFAQAIELAPETLSHWENDAQTVDGWADKAVRTMMLLQLADQVQGPSLDPKAIVNMRIQDRPAGQWPAIEVFRAHSTKAEAGVDEWDATLPAAA